MPWTRSIAGYPVNESYRGDSITLKAVYNENDQMKAIEDEPVAYIAP